MFKIKSLRITKQRSAIFLIFLLFVSTNAFWGYKLIHDTNIVPAMGAFIPLCLVILCYLEKEVRVDAILFTLATLMYLTILIQSRFGIKESLFYGLCIIILLYSDCWNEVGMLKLFYYSALLFAIGSLISVFFDGIYSSIVLPQFRNSSQYVRLLQWHAGGHIFPGFMNQTSFNAGFLAYGIGYLFCFRPVKTKRIIIQALIFILLMICLVLTNKRSFLLFVFFSMGICYYFAGKSKERAKRILVILLAGIGLLLFLYVMITYSDFGVFRKIGIMFENLDEGEDITSGRTFMWATAMQYFKQHPVFGVGWGKLRTEMNAQSGINLEAHNIYVQLLCEVGIVGFILFLIYFIYSYWTAINNCRFAAQEKDIQSTRFCLFMQSLFLLYGITGNPLYDPPFYMPYFLICAYSFSFAKTHRNRYSVLERII